MNQFRLFQSVAAGLLLTVMPVTGAVNAQSSSQTPSATCPGGGPRQLSKQENSMVNDYEILLARANSAHTAPPDLSPDVAALLACSANGPAAPTSSSPAAPSSTSTSTTTATCPGGPRLLSKEEGSMVNDYEILLARANSAHTTPPDLSPDVAALLACSSGSSAASTSSSPASPSSSSASTMSATCPGGGPRTLTKQEGSMVNDYEILLARANSAHTTPPDLSPDVAALLACSG